MMTIRSFRILVLTTIVLGSSSRCCLSVGLLKKQSLETVPADELEKQQQKRQQQQQLVRRGNTTATATATNALSLTPTGRSAPFWHRWLSQTNPTDVVLAGLVNLFIPALADDIENTVVQGLDPIDIDYREEKSLGDVNVPPEQSFCNDTSATLMFVYEIANMTGLSTMDIQRLELVPGSQDITIPVGALFGAQKATWSCKWMVEAEFTRFNTFTTGRMQTTLCDFTFEQLLTGISTARRPHVYFTIKLQGKTDNIYQFNEQSTVQKADIQEVKVSIESFTSRLGSFNDRTTMNANTLASEMVESRLNDGTFESLVQEAVQKGINSNLPYRLGH